MKNGYSDIGRLMFKMDGLGVRREMMEKKGLVKSKLKWRSFFTKPLFYKLIKT